MRLERMLLVTAIAVMTMAAVTMCLVAIYVLIWLLKYA